MAKELQKTLKLENEEYNINAVRSDTAETADKTQAALTIKESGLKQNGDTDTGFNGSVARVIDFVPADKGGVFKQPIYIASLSEKREENAVITSGQVNNRIAELAGSPICSVDASTYQIIPLKDTNKDQVYKLTTIVGTTEDFNELNTKFFATPDTGADSRGLFFGYYSNYTYCKVRGIQPTSQYLDLDVVIPYIAYRIYNGRVVDKVPVTMMEDAAFKSQQITSAVIPGSISTISKQAFMSCTSLKAVTVLPGVTVIGEEAFSGCTGLESIILPDTITSISSNAFYNCSKLKTIKFGGSEIAWSDLINNATAEGNAILTSSVEIYYEQHTTGSIFNGPFVYICKDEETATTPASNKMFLKLPGEDIIEISNGADRLNSTTTDENTYYYTYDNLAEIIARINNRLAAIEGSNKLAIPDNILQIPSNLKPSEDIDVPTLDGLAEEIIDETTYDTDLSSGPVLKAVGGIAVGDSLVKEYEEDGVTPKAYYSVKEILDKMLYPYTKPVINSFTINPDAAVREKGTSVTVNKATVSVTKKTNQISSITLYKQEGSNTAAKVTTTQSGFSANGGTTTLTCSDTIAGTANTYKYYVNVTDSSGQTTKSSEKTFTFVYPYYRGVIGATTSISASVVTGLNKEVQTKGNYSYTYTTSNQKPVIAYPKSYGELKSITDAALPYTWTRSEVTVTANDKTNVVYYVYVGDASTMTNTYNFKY